MKVVIMLVCAFSNGHKSNRNASNTSTEGEARGKTKWAVIFNLSIGKKNKATPCHLFKVFDKHFIATILWCSWVILAPEVERFPLSVAFLIRSELIERFDLVALLVDVEAYFISWINCIPVTTADAREDLWASIVPDAAFGEAPFGVSQPFLAAIAWVFIQARFKHLFTPAATGWLWHVVLLQADWCTTWGCAKLSLSQSAQKRYSDRDLEILHYQL